MITNKSKVKLKDLMWNKIDLSTKMKTNCLPYYQIKLSTKLKKMELSTIGKINRRISMN